MIFHPRFIGGGLRIVALLVCTATSGFAAATISQFLLPGQVAMGEKAVLTLTVNDPGIGSSVMLPTVDVQLPAVEGLQMSQAGMSISVGKGNATTTLKYALVPIHSGTFTIPDFAVRTRGGEVLQVKTMTLTVTDGGTGSPNSGAALATQLMQLVNTATATPVNPRGPLLMPPPNPPASPHATPVNPADATSSPPEVQTPREADGTPAKVFLVITPETTDAYVGQAILMKIDFFIRAEVYYDQNSLPTIKGSNFLMNGVTNHGMTTNGLLEQQQYQRESWLTTIAATKSGDFPLSMQRDTYWVKSFAQAPNSIFGFFNRSANLAHEMISSNVVTMHIHDLPTEGRPEHFTGAIGQLKVTAESGPSTVSVGDPVHLRFSISGDGNFDYVRAPVLRHDPAWKAYVPTSAIRFVNESHAQALKVFDQSVIPQKGGVLPLPEADFSYFDPVAKQYVTVPLKLPDVVVTGSASPVVPVAVGNDSGAAMASASPAVAEMLPNRLEIGSTRLDLTPAFRRAWFWAVQVALAALPLCAALLVLLRYRSQGELAARSSRALSERSRQQDRDAMAAAVRQKDARAFFVAARHAVQLQLGSRWSVSPEALTLREIRTRDPHLAETLEALFRQADEAIYSGHALPAVDLAQWEQRVRTELLQPQPA